MESKNLFTTVANGATTSPGFWWKGWRFCNVSVGVTTNAGIDISLQVHIGARPNIDDDTPATGDAGWVGIEDAAGAALLVGTGHGAPAMGYAPVEHLNGFSGHVRVKFSGDPGSDTAVRVQGSH